MGDEVGPRGGQTRGRRGPRPARAWHVSGPTRSPPTPPLRPYILRHEKTLGKRKEIHGKLRRHHHRRTHLRGFWSTSRHPAGGRNLRRRPSSSPCLPPRQCVSSPPWDYGSIAVARWLSSPCSSCLFGLVSCLT